VLAAQATGRIRLLGHASVTALLQQGRRVTGVEFLQDGRPGRIQADAVLLATGGAGQLFAQTTNPSVATADGLALACRAGAAVADLEFFQFHPTCLVRPDRGAKSDDGQDPLLISEAVRGEGAILVDAQGRRFLHGYHPDAELAPRDVVSRSIALHLAALGDPNGHVYLDARGIEDARGPGFLERRFPRSPAAPARPAWTGPGNWSLSRRPHTTGWAESPPTCTAAPPSRGFSRPAKLPAPVSRAPTAWPATRSSKGLFSGGGRWKRSLVGRRGTALLRVGYRHPSACCLSR
jgi:hypothetical protein